MSGIFKAIGSVKSGNASYEAGMYNAQASDQQAQRSLETAGLNEVQSRDNFQRFQGQQIANMAANGVDTTSGSPLDVLQDSAVSAEYDALKIRHAGILQSDAFQQQAVLQRKGASNALWAGRLGAAASLVGQFDKSYNGNSSSPAPTPSYGGAY